MFGKCEFFNYRLASAVQCVRRRARVIAEISLLVTLLLVVVAMDRKSAMNERELRRALESSSLMDDESAQMPPPQEEDINAQIREVPEKTPMKPTIKFRAVGLHADSWYYSALKGTFDMCYDEGYIDRSLSCEYIDEEEHFSGADVVIMRGSQLDQSPLAKKVFSESGRRLPHQWWVFFDNEPPYKVWKHANLNKYNGVFNLTATYSSDSDITRVDMRRLRYCVRDTAKYDALKGIDYTKKKRNGTVVAWFASECVTQSKREDYVKELQKYIPVDVYGDCGPEKCGSRELGTWSKDRCHEKLLHREGSYKFYLSFENSLCKDYVTEKLWMLLQMDVIPVVMGMADYANMLPKDSFIDVRDFPSPKALAQYLKSLDRSRTRYNQYLRNKNSLNCFLKYPFMPWECKLCERMHELMGTQKIVYDLAKFWGRDQCIDQAEYLMTRRPDNAFLPK